MNIIEKLKNQISRVWEPVLCPVRTPICNELLGGEFVSVSSDSLYMRHDDHIETPDHKCLFFSTYLKTNDRTQSSLARQDDPASRDSWSPEDSQDSASRSISL